MKSIKTILFCGFALFLLVQSYYLIDSFPRLGLEPESLSLSLLLAFLTNLFITGFFAFPGFVLPTHKVLPAVYYRIRNPKVLTKTYDILGVSYFKILLLLTFWGVEKNRKKYFDGTRQGINNLNYQTKQSEFGHLGAFVLVQITANLALYHGLIWVAAFTSIMNFFSNFYPIILQRYHRIRTGRFTDRLT